MKDLDVEVLTVSRNSDIESGKPSSTIIFGNFVESTPEVRERVAAVGQSPNPDKTIVNRLILFLPDVENPSYLLGSKWVLKMDKDGEINLTKTNKK